jgi:hypothetical protein
MHEIYIRVGALLCFIACKLAGTRCYLCVKNMDGLDGDTIEVKLFYSFLKYILKIIFNASDF